MQVFTCCFDSLAQLRLGWSEPHLGGNCCPNFEMPSGVLGYLGSGLPPQGTGPQLFVFFEVGVAPVSPRLELAVPPPQVDGDWLMHRACTNVLLVETEPV